MHAKKKKTVTAVTAARISTAIDSAVVGRAEPRLVAQGDEGDGLRPLSALQSMPTILRRSQQPLRFCRQLGGKKGKRARKGRLLHSSAWRASTQIDAGGAD